MSVTAIFMALFSVLCYTGQNFFNKLYAVNYHGPSETATPVFAAIYGLLTGIATLAINILMLTLRLVPASVLYTVDNGGVLILCALLGTVVLHEKLEKHMVAGLAAAVVSLVFLGM